VTFLFTDIEGSTELLQRLGNRYAVELQAHRTATRDAVVAAGGEVVDQHGDELFAAFSAAGDAVRAAVEIQRWHADRTMRVRIGLHTGEPSLAGDGYLGLDVHRAARICAAGHGGQILISQTTCGLAGEFATRDLGEYLLRGIATPERIFAVEIPGRPRSFPALRAEPARRQRRSRPLSATAQSVDLGARAWSVRATLPATPVPERPAVTRLMAALFAAAKVDSAVSMFFARADRGVLEQHLAS
jgi:Adenylate and Guanylate cyclase catalytic domain